MDYKKALGLWCVKHVADAQGVTEDHFDPTDTEFSLFSLRHSPYEVEAAWGARVAKPFQSKGWVRMKNKKAGDWAQANKTGVQGIEQFLSEIIEIAGGTLTEE